MRELTNERMSYPMSNLTSEPQRKPSTRLRQETRNPMNNATS